MNSNKKHLYYGLALIVGSFIYWFLPDQKNIIGFANAVFFVGNIMLFDYISEKYSGYSLLKTPNRRKHFLILGLIFGLVLEFYLDFIGKFWYYPRWEPINFAILFVPGFAVYSFYLLETYLGVKAILEHLFIKRRKKIDFRGLKNFFISIGIIGAVAASSATTYLLLNMTEAGWKSALQTNLAREGNIENWYLYFIVFIGIWFLLEFFEYEKRETSIIYQIIKGNPWPLVAVFIAGLFSAVLYEVFNIPGGLWRYVDSNVPFNEIRFLGFPIMMYIGWPFHYLPLISIYRILFKEETKQLTD